MTRSRTRSEPIAELLSGNWMDPDTGVATGVDIAAIAIDDDLRGREAELVETLGLGRRLVVLSDAVTHQVLGARVERALSQLFRVESIVLPRGPHADLPTVEALRTRTAPADALVAVGSGTINDLAKYASALDAKPYAVFPTAPSMNGYTSANAAITVSGHKKTLPAALARGVFIDLAVLCAAPPRMIRAGLGDSLCRPTAQVDWLLAHRLLDLPYRRAPFVLLEADEAVLFDAPEALLRGDRDAMRALARTLVLSGIGMTLCGGSYPASQGEHLISHYLDMLAPSASEFLHGEQVAVATLAMARLQESMLDAPAPLLHATGADEQRLQSHFGDEVGAACWRDFTPKCLDTARAAVLNRRLAEMWDSFREEAHTLRIPAKRLESVMQRAGGPTCSGDIGVDTSTWDSAVRHARFLRDRFTFLDLADDSDQF